MNHVIETAIASTLTKSAKKNREKLEVGKYDIDTTVTLHVKGTVNVSAGGTYRPTASIPLKSALALFLRYSGVTGPAAMDALVRAMNEAIEAGEDADDTIGEIADINAAMATVISGLEKLPPTNRNGSVTSKVTVTFVGTESTEEAEDELNVA